VVAAQVARSRVVLSVYPSDCAFRAIERALSPSRLTQSADQIGHSFNAASLGRNLSVSADML